MKLSFIYTLFSFICLCPFSYGQIKELNCSNITSEFGYSELEVRDVFQDKDGLMWFATFNGLMRFDGSSLKVIGDYRNKKYSLKSDLINVVVGDKYGNLWIAHAKGISCYNKLNGRIINYDLVKLSEQHISNAKIDKMVVDAQGTVWFATYEELFKFNPQTQKVTRVNLPTYKAVVNRIRHLMIDSHGWLWIVCEGSLFQCNIRTQKVTLKVLADNITHISQQNDSTYWLCTWGDGFVKYNGKDTPQKRNYLDKGRIYLYGQTDVEGVTHFLNESEIVTLSDNSISRFHLNKTCNVSRTPGRLYFDHQNNMWISSADGAIFVDVKKQFIHLADLQISKSISTEHKIPLPLFADKQEMIFASWYNGGYFEFNKDLKFKKYEPKLPGSGNHDHFRGIYDLYKDKKASQWFLTNESLYCYDPNTKKSKEYYPPNHVYDKIALREILEWDDGKLLLLSRNGGLYLFDLKTENFSSELIPINKMLRSSTLYDIQRHKKNYFYIATSTGLFLLNQKKKILIRTENREVCKVLLSDQNEQTWVGTESGLYCINNGKQIQYTTKNGLLHNYIEDIICDKNQNIWALTLGGISVFNQQSQSFFNITKEYGLPRNKLEGYLACAPDGDVLLTDNNFQMFKINPDELIKENTNFKAQILDVFLNDSLAHWEVKSNGRKVLNIAHSQTNIKIKFAIPDFQNRGQILYNYRLNNLDTDWKMAEHGLVTFNNLKPGNYILKVKGVYTVNHAQTEEDTLAIRVNPEWYESWWFYVTIVVGVIAIVWLVIRRRIINIQKENEYKSKLLETKVHLMRTQMNPHFIFNSINSIENYVMKNEKRKASDYLNQFSKLIRGILENSRSNLIPLKKELEYIGYYVDLEQMRYNNRFEFKVDMDADIQDDQIFIPPMIIQPFIENAILHGISHSEKEDLCVKLSIKHLEQDFLTIIVEDNGVGREKSKAYKSHMKSKNKSEGMKMTTERIMLFNKVNAHSLKIIDLFDEQGHSCGTRVEFPLRILMNENL